ncbi:alpha-hydroxy-acid oxidizing enzyme [Marinicauda salina]|uniref:Alpha-hydroxy-acid oxidizing enzyme n=1 Tax=Marinicauda salina TaxID=2135793 RepID=A0A2U2BX11_9PROT|nr:alpha-hydroxy acid oxidase [Marinicauda salina]PWE18504.1 alpha-hydroxy-acid oxidizing enzyme [Marinicauda salina]
MATPKALNLADFRPLARKRLPAPMFHYIAGGADDEWSLANNTDAFARYELVPRHLNDISEIDLSTRVLGADLAMPLILSPTGMNRLFHHGKELAVARAAEAAGVMYSLSTVGTASIEDVASVSAGPKMFQIYMFKDRGLTREFVERCKQAGYNALCLTVDTTLAGNRERELRTGLTMPPKLTAASLASFLVHPHWLGNFLRDPDFTLANVAHRVDALEGGAMSLVGYVNSQFDRSLTWDDAAELVELWDGPFVIKGLQHADDARRAAEIGASAVMISNHGGRQLDSAPAPVECVADMREAVGDRLELIVDGGVRRGTHALKALALGADAVSFGRPYLYALAAGGEDGVTRMLHLFRQEIERSIALAGCASVEQAKRDGLAVRRVGA